MSMRICAVLGHILLAISGIGRRVRRAAIRPLFASCGRQVSFDPSDAFTYATIHIGNRVYIGRGAAMSAKVCIRIGDDVMFGPGVCIMAGDHNTELRGVPMARLEKKRSGDDLPVVIDNDVWIGARVTILKGVRIGSGAVVAAGSVVTRDVPPFSIVAGVPARVLRYRGTQAEIDEHLRTYRISTTDGRGLK